MKTTKQIIMLYLTGVQDNSNTVPQKGMKISHMRRHPAIPDHVIDTDYSDLESVDLINGKDYILYDIVNS